MSSCIGPPPGWIGPPPHNEAVVAPGTFKRSRSNSDCPPGWAAELKRRATGCTTPSVVSEDTSVVADGPASSTQMSSPHIAAMAPLSLLSDAVLRRKVERSHEAKTMSELQQECHQLINTATSAQVSFVLHSLDLQARGFLESSCDSQFIDNASMSEMQAVSAVAQSESSSCGDAASMSFEETHVLDEKGTSEVSSRRKSSAGLRLVYERTPSAGWTNMQRLFTRTAPQIVNGDRAIELTVQQERSARQQQRPRHAWQAVSPSDIIAQRKQLHRQVRQHPESENPRANVLMLRHTLDSAGVRLLVDPWGSPFRTSSSGSSSSVLAHMDSSPFTSYGRGHAMPFLPMDIWANVLLMCGFHDAYAACCRVNRVWFRAAYSDRFLSRIRFMRTGRLPYPPVETRVLAFRMQGVTHIDLSQDACDGDGGPSDGQLRELWRACSDVCDVDLSLAEHLSDAGIDALSRHWKRVTRLNLCECTGLTNASLDAVGQNLSHLQCLNLSGIYGISDAGLVAVASGCHELRQLDIRRCHLISDVGMIALAQSCRHLEQLRLYWNKSVTDEGIMSIARRCRRLKVLHIPGVSAGNDAVRTIAECLEQLESLDIMFLPVSLSAVLLLSMSTLKRLVVAECENLKGDMHKLIACLPECHVIGS